MLDRVSHSGDCSPGELLSFYDEEYYRSHGHLPEDESHTYLLAQYWREAIFVESRLDPCVAVLDYGSGVGSRSLALPNCLCYDPSEFARSYLRRIGRPVVDTPEAIPKGHFGVILSSHVLEHSLTPASVLRELRTWIKPEGLLVVVIPVEPWRRPTVEPDANRHLYCWTFQTITNLLWTCGWRALRERYLYGPFMLTTLRQKLRLPEACAVKMAVRLGRLKRSWPSLLVIAASRLG
jgi:SAM-dependent methyltransferase